MIATTEPRYLEKLAVRYRKSHGQDRPAFEAIRLELQEELIDWVCKNNRASAADAALLVNTAFAHLDLFLLARNQPLQPVRAWMYAHLWRETDRATTAAAMQRMIRREIRRESAQRSDA